MFSKFTFLPCQILAVAWLVSLEKMQKSGIFLLALSSPDVGVQVTITTTSNGSNTKSPEVTNASKIRKSCQKSIFLWLEVLLLS